MVEKARAFSSFCLTDFSCLTCLAVGMRGSSSSEQPGAMTMKAGPFLEGMILFSLVNISEKKFSKKFLQELSNFQILLFPDTITASSYSFIFSELITNGSSPAGFFLL